MSWLFLPFVLQGFAMWIDEFYFHRRRGLPAWERFGHPVDSASVLACYLFLALQDPSPAKARIYIALGVFSSLLVTKDEFVHARLCEPMEIWLHSVLFILHPVTFFCAGVLWVRGEGGIFIQVQAFLIFAFMLYQIIYWCSPWFKSCQTIR